MSVAETTNQDSRTVLVTDAAVKKIAELIAAEDSNEELMLRVAVKPGGCSGMSYDMYFDQDKTADDVVEEYEIGGEKIRVAVDPTSAQLIKGATLDYKDGLQGAGFAINNPNATKSCGCGQSFS